MGPTCRVFPSTRCPCGPLPPCVARLCATLPSRLPTTTRPCHSNNHPPNVVTVAACLLEQHHPWSHAAAPSLSPRCCARVRSAVVTPSLLHRRRCLHLTASNLCRGDRSADPCHRPFGQATPESVLPHFDHTGLTSLLSCRPPETAASCRSRTESSPSTPPLESCTPEQCPRRHRPSLPALR